MSLSSCLRVMRLTVPSEVGGAASACLSEAMTSLERTPDAGRRGKGRSAEDGVDDDEVFRLAYAAIISSSEGLLLLLEGLVLSVLDEEEEIASVKSYGENGLIPLPVATPAGDDDVDRGTLMYWCKGMGKVTFSFEAGTSRHK